MGDIEVLQLLTELAEINIQGNPLCIHSKLKQMIQETCPNIELINDQAICEAGSRYKKTKEQLLRKLQNQYYKKGEEPTEADDILLEDQIDKQANNNDHQQLSEP